MSPLLSPCAFSWHCWASCLLPGRRHLWFLFLRLVVLLSHEGHMSLLARASSGGLKQRYHSKGERFHLPMSHKTVFLICLYIHIFCTVESQIIVMCFAFLYMCSGVILDVQKSCRGSTDSRTCISSFPRCPHLPWPW